MKSKRKVLYGISALLLSGTMVFSAMMPALSAQENSVPADSGAVKGLVSDVTGTVKSDLTQYYDRSVTEALPESIPADREISVILCLDTDTVLDVYHSLDTDLTLGEFAASGEGRNVSAAIEKQTKTLLTRLSNAGVPYEIGDRYDTLLGGVEVLIKANHFGRLCGAMEGKAAVMVGEEYAMCESRVVTNDVNVYESTGIFDSSESAYDGTGTVIAVLDTGLDYTHSAFNVSRFTDDEESDVITPESLSGVIGQLEASKTTPGLTPANVYLSRKVPYAYDYADKDDNVAPINSEHGTHVAGVMVGKDDKITGVAPNAQLAVMKVFSESSSGAKTSWLIAALEDCVTLGVDVINMSLGTAAGFSRETDEDIRYEVYDRVKEEGISLVAAASNDYNSTFGSEKNGNLGLTSNPDSSTVGAPSTYDAALSVASISGVKTPYLRYNGQVVYYTEASDSAAKPKDFVTELLNNAVKQNLISEGVDTCDFEYVIIDGIGSAQNFVQYSDGSLHGKIALIRRGQTNFEEKASLARQYGAVGCIIYNNVSGTIAMNVGHLGDYPVCSLSQDDGEMLVRGGNGKITVSRNQKAGPFMSDFSSWGPTPDLRIKPEITAHGGDIYSAVPGQSYDRLSGTSMASPNQAGVTALVRQYVKDTLGLDGNTPEIRRQITATVNQLMMSTADIAYNTNGLPFSVRKQGAGLANLQESTSTPAYLQTFERDAEEPTVMDKTKIELGDDPAKTGVYRMKFNIVNLKSGDLRYEVGAIVMTEGVSETLTYKGDTTVTEKGYLLEGAEIEVEGAPDRIVTVRGNSTLTVTLTVTLTEENKSYLDASFKNGMYVEGFVTLTSKDSANQIGLNAPFLAYYGDWSQPPLFDLDYFATNADELDDSKETLEKTLPDAYATRPIGGLYDDYIAYLGGYPFLQDPASTSKISADREHISLTNQTGEDGGINSISSVQLGLLRGAKRMVATVTDASTGEVIFTKEQLNRSKAYNYGGAIYGSSFDVDFNVADYDLKNNTKYIFRLQGYIDYKDGHVANDTFEFPFYTDFTAPIVTGVEYTYEYDRSTETNRLFANVSIYDNHYVRAIIPGYIANSPAGASAPYTIYGFTRYPIPVVSERNSTGVVQIELTDYIQQLKKSSYNHRSFMVQVVDCAQNTAMYELTIPDNIATIDFPDEEIQISPNEVYNLKPEVFPTQDKAWMESINYTSSDEKIARVVNGKLVGVSSGDIILTATSNFNKDVTTTVKVKVLKDGDPGYRKLDRPVAENFRLTGYLVNRVYYFVSSDERDLGATEPGTEVKFASSNSYALKMLPSESVTIQYDLRGYFDDKNYEVEFTSSNPNVATVDEKGTIVAKNVDEKGNALNYERTTTITVLLRMLDPDTGEYKPTITTRSIVVTVKAPYTTNGPYLLSYMGLGDKVVIPEDLGITDIQQFAFSNWNLVPKDLNAGDEITEEDPYYSKQWYIGDDTITEVVIPEGVKTIGMYAFANLTALRKVTLPSTLTKIQTGAFIGCTNLTQVAFNNNQNNLQFINQQAFEDCDKLVSFDFRSIIAIGDAAFRNAGLISIQLPSDTQSIGAYAFKGNERLSTVSIEASKVKVGAGAFAECAALKAMSLNAAVLPAEIFYGCTQLQSLKLGADVEVIGQNALRGTDIETLDVDSQNRYFEQSTDKKYLTKKGTTTLALVAPSVTQFDNSTITEIDVGAFSAAVNLLSVNLPKVTKVGDYAFTDCSRLSNAKFGELESVGEFAFAGTAITSLPNLKEGVTIGDQAFAMSPIREVTLPDSAVVGNYAFAQMCSQRYSTQNGQLVVLVTYTLNKAEIGDNVTLGEGAFFANPLMTSVEIGDNATIGEGAFTSMSASSLVGAYATSGYSYTYGSQTVNTIIDPYISALTSVEIGDNATIGAYAFQGAGGGEYTISSRTYGGKLTTVTLGDNAVIGEFAFFNCHYLTEIDLTSVKSIGNYAFSGQEIEYIRFDTGSLLPVRVMPYAASLEEVTLTGLDCGEESLPLGEGAFAYVETLSSVTLPEGLTSIAADAFFHCSALEEIDLTHVTSVGAGAFASTPLKEVTLAEESAPLFLDGAFEDCTQLTAVNGLERASYIGSSAFRNTGLTSVSFESEALMIGDFAFADSKVVSVSLGEGILSLGENPFVGCAISDFTDADGNTTFDAGRSVKVIDGVLYDSRPSGLVLITYPKMKAEKSFSVAENVVRIGAQAFRGAPLLSVQLSRRVKAIGDKAFYECDGLSAVSFTSIEAPILEEQYQTSVEEVTSSNVPRYLSNNVAYYIYNSTEHGLKIVPFQSWLADPTNVLHGANFIAEIGTPEGREIHKDKTLVMVRPINGTGYENFLFEQYFDVVLDGPTAISDATQEIIDRINALPSPVSLADREEVEGIRSGYDALSADQQGRVDNYNVLQTAENRIRFLLSQEETPPEADPTEPRVIPHLWVYVLLGIVAAAALIAVAVVMLVKKDKKTDGAKENEAAEGAQDMATEEEPEETGNDLDEE